MRNILAAALAAGVSFGAIEAHAMAWTTTYEEHHMSSWYGDCGERNGGHCFNSVILEIDTDDDWQSARFMLTEVSLNAFGEQTDYTSWNVVSHADFDTKARLGDYSHVENPYEWDFGEGSEGVAYVARGETSGPVTHWFEMESTDGDLFDDLIASPITVDHRFFGDEARRIAEVMLLSDRSVTSYDIGLFDLDHNFREQFSGVPPLHLGDDPAVAPVPGSLALALAGFAGLGWLARRRK